jgi:hypothetical protein
MLVLIGLAEGKTMLVLKTPDMTSRRTHSAHFETSCYDYM